MNWNEKTVKAIVFNRETGQREQQTLSPKEIVSNPLGKEPETVVFAMAKIVTELANYKEAELERIGELYKKVEAKNQVEMELK